ncbi:MAG: class I SAM-dependent methyltransferase [Solirubrobacterales bacterium]|nr:class I SAM-dependent methyltransferase [Solirubrobacterales bacterium]MBV9801083.1 class I SAM-dependent methyltransferase [Solirubrobacterales bacterium]
MPMNRIHNVLCSSGWWSRTVRSELLPWGLEGVELGDEVLEVGPGFGATTKVLAGRTEKLSVVELDEGYVRRLRSELPESVSVTEGDATDLPYPDGRFSAVVCFTMLHHIPTRELQDRAFAEVARVLAPEGTFAGTDSLGAGWLFKLIHVGDTLNLVDPGGLPARLKSAGLSDPEVDLGGRSLRFRARKRA